MTTIGSSSARRVQAESRTYKRAIPTVPYGRHCSYIACRWQTSSSVHVVPEWRFVSNHYIHQCGWWCHSCWGEFRWLCSHRVQSICQSKHDVNYKELWCSNHHLSAYDTKPDAFHREKAFWLCHRYPFDIPSSVPNGLARK